MGFFGDLWHILLPPDPTVTRAHSVTSADLATEYTVQKVDDVVTLGAYQSATIRTLITANKFHRDAHSAQLLGELLRRWIQQQRVTYTIVPIPLSRTRYRERGYNQVECIVRHAIVDGPHTLRTDLLFRPHDRPAQTSLSRRERLQNMENAFVADDHDVATAHLLVVDDVLTTGATLRAAKVALLPLAPASLTFVAIAH